MDGRDVLGEIDSEAAMLLWKGLRALTLWSSVLPSERMELFSPQARQRRIAEILIADIDADLRSRLEALVTLLDPAGRARRELIALTCRQIAQWAAGRGARATEMAFVEAAAFACPADADLALLAGRLNRARGDTARAEAWYRRAILLSRQSGDWRVYARGFVYRGSLARGRGNFRLARRLNLKALRTSTAYEFTEGRAIALHELFAVALDCDEARQAQRYAQEAFRAYGARHPNLRYLAHDLACLWIREGQFARALPVLQSLNPLFHGEEKLLGTCNIVRAAGGLGDPVLFHESWARAEILVRDASRNSVLAAALLSLARGATGVGEWDSAEEMAQRALQVATESASGDVIFAAEAVLDLARNRRAFEENVRRADAVETADPQEEQVDVFASELCSSLRALAMV